MSKNALIIFARYPREGEVKTRLGAEIGMGRAMEIYKRLAEHAFGVGQELMTAGFQVYLFYEPSADETEMKSWVKQPFDLCPQDGSDLGERMGNAFRKTRSDGASKSIIIGTDLPELEAGLIEGAFQLLDHNQVVIGPSVDGGYYLLGMKGAVGDLFSGIVWSTPHVFSDTLTKCRNLKLSYVVLKQLADIDTKEDLLRFAGKFERP